MKMVRFAIWAFTIGSLFFLLQSEFRTVEYKIVDGVEVPVSSMWDDLYYIWTAVKDLLLWLAVCSLIRGKQFKFLTIPPLIYFIILVLWAIITTVTDVDANHSKAWTIIFTSLLTGLAILLGVDWVKRKRKKEL